MEITTALVSKLATFEGNNPLLSAVTLCTTLTGIAHANIQRVRTAVHRVQVEHRSPTVLQPPAMLSSAEIPSSLITERQPISATDPVSESPETLESVLSNGTNAYCSVVSKENHAIPEGFVSEGLDFASTEFHWLSEPLIDDAVSQFPFQVSILNGKQVTAGEINGVGGWEFPLPLTWSWQDIPSPLVGNTDLPQPLTQ
jgi:hypothetical protein